MANTTNYNWETPDDTDLVKDGAAAIRTLGNSIDTTTKNLNPETTTGDIAYRSATANTNTRLPIGSAGQVLTVAAGVPSWATPTTGDIEGVTAGTGISGGGTSGTVTITNSMATEIDAKGDLIVGTGADTFARLAVGTNGHTLVADSSVSPTGLKWAAAAAGSLTLITTTTVSSAVADITFSSIPSTYQHLSIIFSGRSNKGGNYVDNLRIQMNGVTSSNYQNLYAGGFNTMTVTNAGTTTFADLRYISAEGLMTNGEQGTGIIYFPDYKLTTLKKMIHWETRGVADSPAWFSGQAKLNFTTAVSSIKLFLDGGSFMTGTTASLYGWS